MGKRIGGHAQQALLDEVAAGAYALESFDSGDVGRAAGVVERFRELDLGLADASIVVLAERHGATRVLTLDERHFRALRTSDGAAFELLPSRG